MDQMNRFFDRLDTLHALYGRGTVTATVLFEGNHEVVLPIDENNFYGWVEAKLQYGTAKRHFRVVNGTLFYCGRQTKLKRDFKY